MLYGRVVCAELHVLSEASGVGERNFVCFRKVNAEEASGRVKGGFEPVETHGCLSRQNGAFLEEEARVSSLVALRRPFSVGSLNPGGVRVPKHVYQCMFSHVHQWTAFFADPLVVRAWKRNSA